MRAGQSVEAALHLTVLLALLQRGECLSAAHLADFHALPTAATAKLVQHLAAAGIVEAREGRTGGYRLARAVDSITLGEIVDAAGGSAPRFQCREIRQHGPCAGAPDAYSARCAIAVVMDDAERAWWASLQQLTLADLARRVGKQVDCSLRNRAAEWLGERTRT